MRCPQFRGGFVHFYVPGSHHSVPIREMSSFEGWGSSTTVYLVSCTQYSCLIKGTVLLSMVSLQRSFPKSGYLFLFFSLVGLVVQWNGEEGRRVCRQVWSRILVHKFKNGLVKFRAHAGLQTSRNKLLHYTKITYDDLDSSPRKT